MGNGLFLAYHYSKILNFVKADMLVAQKGLKEKITIKIALM